jgi:ribonuclease D
MKLPPPILVQTHAAWRECLVQLRRSSSLAIDTESNSLHAYREQVCLIQISTLDQDYIIDPLCLPDLDGMGELMADPTVEKVFHAAEYDILCLKRDFAYTFVHLFDTMLASRILGWRKNGLAAILAQEFGVRADKRYQRANWGRRPLPPEQIAYAQMDTHYLLPLRDKMAVDLEAAGWSAAARESFARMAKVTPSPRTSDSNGFWRLLNGRPQLTPQQHAVLRELYFFRDREAQRRDLPPFKILGDQTPSSVACALNTRNHRRTGPDRRAWSSPALMPFVPGAESAQQGEGWSRTSLPARKPSGNWRTAIREQPRS